MAADNSAKSTDDVVVLTGTIGAGKSTVAAIFKRLGATVISADELARAVVEPGMPALEAIEREFGSEVLLPSGRLNRKRLGEIIFADAAKRKRLESITHPEIRALAATRFSEARAQRPPLIVYDCPLFFEAALERSGFRAVVVVSARDEVCLSRVMQRDGLNETQVRQRLSQQLPTAEKIAKADHVVDNSGTLAELDSQVAALFHLLTS